MNRKEAYRFYEHEYVRLLQLQRVSFDLDRAMAIAMHYRAMECIAYKEARHG